MNSLVVCEYVNRHENYLQTILGEYEVPAIQIKKAIEYVVLLGGKRLRPVLVYLCGNLLKIDVNCLDIIATSIEMIHCYSLVHDDLPAMDDDDMRRGKPSCHRAFDEATAILVGDGLQALAIDILLSNLPRFVSDSQVIAVTAELLKACGPMGMVSGQSLDLSELSKPTTDETILRKIHELKTGKLILACINMVLMAGNPSKEEANALQEYGKLLGLAYQMQDDYLDCYDEHNLLGKGRASDSANHKITYANLYSKEALAHLIERYFREAQAVLTIFNDQAYDLIAYTHFLLGRSQN